MLSASQREWVGKFAGAKKDGEWDEASIGESFANCSTPTFGIHPISLTQTHSLYKDGRTDMIVMTMAQ